LASQVSHNANLLLMRQHLPRLFVFTPFVETCTYLHAHAASQLFPFWLGAHRRKWRETTHLRVCLCVRVSCRTCLVCLVSRVFLCSYACTHACMHSWGCMWVFLCPRDQAVRPFARSTIVFRRVQSVATSFSSCEAALTPLT
jgi:hypothetical protein